MTTREFVAPVVIVGSIIGIIYYLRFIVEAYAK
jgi:NADH:ubiquinone oxidoreductase subunit 2 (subunit N)